MNSFPIALRHQKVQKLNNEQFAILLHIATGSLPHRSRAWRNERKKCEYDKVEKKGKEDEDDISTSAIYPHIAENSLLLIT
jgi:hypothetical protein